MKKLTHDNAVRKKCQDLLVFLSFSPVYILLVGSVTISKGRTERS